MPWQGQSSFLPSLQVQSGEAGSKARSRSPLGGESFGDQLSAVLAVGCPIFHSLGRGDSRFTYPFSSSGFHLGRGSRGSTPCISHRRSEEHTSELQSLRHLV